MRELFERGWRVGRDVGDRLVAQHAAARYVAALRLLLLSWPADVWSDDPRIQLHYAEACWAAGDAPAAHQALAIIDRDPGTLSIAERERLGRLRQAVEPKTK